MRRKITACTQGCNFAIDFQRIKTSFIVSLYLFAKIGLFFEFDHNVHTVKWLPVFQRLNNTRRIMFLLFSVGWTIGGK